jgi:hypothetical protein
MQSPIEAIKNTYLSNNAHKNLTYVYSILLGTQFKGREYCNLEKQDLVMKVCSVSEYTARLFMYNHPAEASEDEPVG